MFPQNNQNAPRPMPPQGGAAPPPRPMPPTGAAPGPGAPTAASGGQPMQMPPELAGKIDPNNPVQMTLLQRVEALSWPEIQQFKAGISPQAMVILKKVVPEIGFLLDQLAKAPSAQDAAGISPPPGAGNAMPPGAGNAPPPAAGAPSLPRPATRLGAI